MELYKDLDGVFKFKGVLSFREKNKHLFSIKEYIFKEIDLIVKAEDSFVDQFYRRNVYSENTEVNLIIKLFKDGLLDSKIKDVFTTKETYYCKRDYEENWDYIMTTLQVYFEMYGYGFNNTICYSISLEELFKMEFSKIPKRLVDLFLFNGINLQSKNKTNEVLKLTTKKITNYATS